MRSASAIGEQYVDFALPQDDSESNGKAPTVGSAGMLRDGSVVTGEITVPISGVIDRADGCWPRFRTAACAPSSPRPSPRSTAAPRTCSDSSTR